MDLPNHAVVVLELYSRPQLCECGAVSIFQLERPYDRQETALGDRESMRRSRMELRGR